MLVGEPKLEDVMRVESKLKEVSIGELESDEIYTVSTGDEVIVSNKKSR